MKKTVLAAAALASMLGLAGCGTPQGDRAAGGAVLGGAAATGRPGGALAGAAVGAASGAIIGAATTPPPRRCARVGYDYYGNRVCVAYYE